MPSDIAVRLIAYLLVALGIFLSGVKVENWRLNAKHAVALEKQFQEARDRERGMNNAREKIEQNYASKLAQQNRSLAAANRDRDGLRDKVAAFNAVSSSPIAADGTDDADADAGLLGRASALALGSVKLVERCDGLADRATQDAKECERKLSGLQQYVTAVCQRQGIEK